MKRAYIIHGWTGKPDEHWLPWLGNELRKNGFEVHAPEMPETENPKVDSWLAYLKQQVGTADRDTYFVGHSIGCLAILRYLEKYKEKIGGAILVAPWVTLNPESFADPEDGTVVEKWVGGGFDWDALKEHCPHFIALFSEDDSDVPFDENKPVFENQLKAKIITYKDKGHFTASEGVDTLPAALDELCKMSGR